MVFGKNVFPTAKALKEAIIFRRIYRMLQLNFTYGQALSV